MAGEVTLKPIRLVVAALVELIILLALIIMSGADLDEGCISGALMSGADLDEGCISGALMSGAGSEWRSF